MTRAAEVKGRGGRGRAGAGASANATDGACGPTTADLAQVDVPQGGIGLEVGDFAFAAEHGQEAQRLHQVEVLVVHGPGCASNTVNARPTMDR